MKNKLIELIKSGGVIIPETAEAVADHLIENKVFVFPEKLNDSWEICSGFIMRLFSADEAEIEKIKREWEFKEIERLNAEKKQILTDICNYLVEKQKKYKPQLCHMDRIMFFVYAEQLFDIDEYAKKLGVEL